MRTAGKSIGLLVLLNALLLLTIPSSGLAEEPAEKFLDALRGAGYYDIALEYLTEVESNSSLTPEFKEALPFEKANTLIKSVATLRDMKEWERRLDDAQGLLEQAATNAVTPELKSKARSYQGELRYSRAKSYTNQIQRNADRLTKTEREKLAVSAREQLNKAVAAFEEAKTLLAEVLGGFQVDPSDPRYSESRLKSLRKRFTNIRIKAPKIVEELADTYTPNDPKYKELLTKAIKGYTEIWEKYRSYDAGYFARYYSARCHYKLGEYSNAINNVRDAMSGSGNATTRQLKPLSLALLADCWSETKPYPYDEVIANFAPYVKKLDRRKLGLAGNVRLRLALARAYHTKAAALKESGENAKAKTFEQDARKIVKEIARKPSVHRAAAKKLASEWNVSLKADAKVAPVVRIETFADAKQAGTDATVELQTLVEDLAVLKRNVRAAKSKDQKAAAQAELDEANKEIETRGFRALGILDQSLGLTDAQTPQAETNNIHYLRCYCYFAMSRYLECSVISEYMLEKFPTVEGTRQASGLLIQSLNLSLDKSLKGEEKAEEIARISKLGDEVISRFPGSKESVLAAKTITQLALVDSDYENAIKYFETVPSSSTSYGGLSIKVGRAAWFDYIGLREVASNTPENADQALMKRRLEQAKTYLEKGVRAQGTTVTYAAALGALYLVDVHVELKDIDAAVKQLETEAIAPIDLVKQKHPAIIGTSVADAFVAKTYKTSIKVYLAALRKNPNQAIWIDKSQLIMQAMRENAQRSNDPKVKKNVDGIYRKIASELKQQFATITDPTEQDKYVENLTQFLRTIQSDTDDPDMARWAGSTLIEIADVLAMRGDTGKGKQKQMTELFQQGLAAFANAKKLGMKDPAKLADVQRMTALAKRGIGKYDEALAIIKDLLKENPRDVRLQLDAVDTLQSWGTQTKRSKALAEALMGAERVKNKDNRTVNLIWGWEQLTLSLKGNPKLEQAYYKSLFGLIEARFEYGVIEDNLKARKAALKVLNNARARDTELGGPAWKSKLEALESKIKKSL